MIQQYIVAHPTTCMLIASILGTAFASTLPEKRPKTLDDWWAWFRDLVHQVGNSRRPTIPNP